MHHRRTRVATGPDTARARTNQNQWMDSDPWLGAYEQNGATHAGAGYGVAASPSPVDGDGRTGIRARWWFGCAITTGTPHRHRRPCIATPVPAPRATYAVAVGRDMYVNRQPHTYVFKYCASMYVLHVDVGTAELAICVMEFSFHLLLLVCLPTSGEISCHGFSLLIRRAFWSIFSKETASIQPFSVRCCGVNIKGV